MKAVVTQFEGDTPTKDYLQAGKDYTEYEAEFDQEDAISLLRRLRPLPSRVLFKGATYTAEFHLQPDQLINVEISSLTAFWAISEVSDSEAESIVGMIYRGEDFGELIPGTEREWDAWGDGS